MNPVKAIAAVFLALVIIVSSAWVQLEAQDNLVRLYRTMWAAKRSNVRMGPGTEHRKVGLLEVGRKVQVTGKVGDWYRIRKGGGHAFVYGPLLSSKPPRTGARRAAAPRRQATPPRQGRQVITYKNGRYEGQVRNGKEHGRGTFTWTSGDRYERDFLDGKITGRGIKTWRAGDRYEGDFVDGERTGHGTYTWADGDRYEGDFVDGKRTGRGTYTWTSGDRYEGDFLDGKITGRGIKTWRAGDRCEGDFVDGKRTGHGTYTWANGSRYTGDFVNGKRIGWGTHVSANGKVKEGEWKDGKLVRHSARMQRQQRIERQLKEAEWQRELDEEMAEFDRQQALQRRIGNIIGGSLNRMGNTLNEHNRRMHLIQLQQEQERLRRELANRGSRSGTSTASGPTCRDPELSCARLDTECQRRWASLPPCPDPYRTAPPPRGETEGFCLDMRTGGVDRDCLRRRGQ